MLKHNRQELVAKYTRWLRTLYNSLYVASKLSHTMLVQWFILGLRKQLCCILAIEAQYLESLNHAIEIVSRVKCNMQNMKKETRK